MSKFLVFLFKCLNGATDHTAHDFVSFFYFTVVPYTGLCVPFTPGLIGPRLFLSVLLSRSLFLLCPVFSIVIVNCIILLLLYESYPIKLLKKIKGRSVPTISRALLGQLNSLKAGEIITLQITGSLSDNKVSVITNKSALH